MASHADQDALSEGEHSVVAGVSVAHGADFGADDGRVHRDAMDEYVLLHVYEEC